MIIFELDSEAACKAAIFMNLGLKSQKCYFLKKPSGDYFENSPRTSMKVRESPHVGRFYGHRLVSFS